MMYKLIIFDLDGTLADTAPDVHFSMNFMRRELGLHPIQFEEAKKAIGPGPNLFVKYISSNDDHIDISKTIKHFRRIYSQHLLDRTQLFPQIRNLIEYLHERQFILMVVTNKPATYSRQILNGLQILKYFNRLLGPEDVPFQKPAPDPILKAMELAGVSPEETLMVGDTEYDIRAAKAAKVDSCAVLYGYSGEEDLLRFSPNYLISNPAELFSIINGAKNSD